MYAVIETGGKQYKVAVGDKLKVEKMPIAEGDSVNIDRVLMVCGEDGVTVGSPLVESPVKATVLSHGKLRKLKVFKMKRRKNYRRTRGHRQSYTEIEITGIGSDNTITVEPEEQSQPLQPDTSAADQAPANQVATA